MIQVTAKMLNDVAALLGTDDKTVVISAVIKTLVDEGATVRDAYEAIFGKGSFKRLSDATWAAARAA